MPVPPGGLLEQQPTALARILGVGAYRPSRLVPNSEVVEAIDSSDEWIRQRSGIESRRWATPEETAQMMSVSAARVALERAGLRDGVTARRAIGYAQVLAAIDDSDGADPEGAELGEAIFRTVVGTRRYVRRQRSWFRRDGRITWLDASAGARDHLLDDALEAIGSAERKGSR